MSRLLYLLPCVLAVLLLVPPPSPAPAAEDAAVQRMVDRGVEYLKSQRDQNGVWGGFDPQHTGYTCLACLALLACGTPPDDPIIVKAADYVRQESIRAHQTYGLALAILFLDRLGQKRDAVLIQSMTARLLAGQLRAGGGWSYGCPGPSNEQAEWLATQVKQHSALATQPGLGGDQKKEGGNELPKPIQQQLQPLPPPAIAGVQQDAMAIAGDNSNTQFAVLGLWVGRKYGLRVDQALVRVDERFRSTQHPDGGWGYAPGAEFPNNSRATMTAAGTMVLGIAWAAVQEKKAPGKPIPDLKKDKVIATALQALATTMDDNVAGIRGAEGGTRLFYYLWSLERVGVAYSLNTIGKKDWYAWGTKVLAATQDLDGGWKGAYQSYGADTAFALLFLKKANLAEDLSSTLKSQVQDPGESVMRSGGVGVPNLGGDKVPKLIANEKASPDDGKPVDRQGAKAGPSAAPSTTAVAGEPGRLAEQLVKPGSGRPEDVLAKLRDGKGSDYTQALAAVIPRLDGDLQKQARQALAERFARMTAATLQARLSDEDAEVRRAAALACAMKEEKGHIPDLIELLKDPEPRVARAAHAALKSLSGQDFGPTAEAEAAERDKAIAAWKDWWSKEGKK